MIIKNCSLEGALIDASDKLRCSIKDLHYEILQNPSKGFLGFGKKEAIIKIIKFESKKDIEGTLLKIKNDLDLIFSVNHFEIESIETLYKNDVIYVNFTLNNPEIMLGKDYYKYKYLDLLMHHLIFLKYNMPVRVNVNNILEMQKNIIKEYALELYQKLEHQDKINSKVMEHSFIAILYDELSQLVNDKNIYVRENLTGRYLCIYKESNK